VVGIAVIAGVLLYQNGILFPEKPAAVVPTIEESEAAIAPTPTLVPVPTDSPDETPLPGVVIDSFEAEKSDVVHGYDPGIRLTWNVLHADRIALYDQSDPSVALYEWPLDSEMAEDGYEVPLAGLPVGSRVFRLEAGSGAVRVEALATVKVWMGCNLDPEVEVYGVPDPDADRIDAFDGESSVAAIPTLDGEWFNISPAGNVGSIQGYVRTGDLTGCNPVEAPERIDDKATATPTVTPLPGTPTLESSKAEDVPGT
jgi:hypothetical protein